MTLILSAITGVRVSNGMFDPTTGLSTNLIPIQTTNAAMCFRFLSPYR
jgi:hypothetical protein